MIRWKGLAREQGLDIVPPEAVAQVIQDLRDREAVARTTAAGPTFFTFWSRRAAPERHGKRGRWEKGVYKSCRKHSSFSGQPSLPTFY